MEIDRIPSVLACDVGNTTIRFAHVGSGKVTGLQQFLIGNLTGLGETLKELWGKIPAPKKLVASSVNPAGLKVLEERADESLHEAVLVIGRDLRVPMEMDVSHPESVGVDRLCCAIAAYDRLGTACVVGDFGTAVTIDCVSDEGVFLGGAILPGLRMGADSLHTATAQLPQVQLTEPMWVIGKDTAEAIVGGLVFGARGALRELVEQYATQLRHWPVVILTGGDAKLVCSDPNASELVQAIVPDLSLRGVAASYYKTIVK